MLFPEFSSKESSANAHKQGSHVVPIWGLPITHSATHLISANSIDKILPSQQLGKQLKSSLDLKSYGWILPLNSVTSNLFPLF